MMINRTEIIRTNFSKEALKGFFLGAVLLKTLPLLLIDIGVRYIEKVERKKILVKNYSRM